MAKMNHRHTYERSKYNMNIYRCVHPQCTHYNRRDMILGKEITCGKCYNSTFARQEQLHAGQTQVGVKTLTCIECSKSPKRYQKAAFEDVLLTLLPEEDVSIFKETDDAKNKESDFV